MNARPRGGHDHGTESVRGLLEKDLVLDGSKRVGKLIEENLGAIRVRLTPGDIDRISDTIPIGAAAGMRYPEGGMRGVYI